MQTIECPHCHVPGVIHAAQGIHGVIPEEVLCGNCEKRFAFRPSWIDRVASEPWPGQNVYYLKPNYRPDPPPKPSPRPPEPTSAERLANVPTKRLVALYKRRSRGRYYETVTIGNRSYSASEVKKVLDGREHVPPKKRK